MELNKIAQNGRFDEISDYVSNTNRSEFGHALAVQQRPDSDSIDAEGGYEAFIGIGMPGGKVDGIRSGKVLIWRPFNEDGTPNVSVNSVKAYNPDSRADTRFGESISALRPLVKRGGFVAGSPNAVTVGDGVQSGSGDPDAERRQRLRVVNHSTEPESGDRGR